MLLAEQKKTWSFLRDNYESLERIRERLLLCNGFSVLLQHNPGRMKSTLAAVGEQDVNNRPCFLCLAQLPEVQKGVLYRDKYLILCNPMPVFSAHFTIANIEHRPQEIFGDIPAFLQLMADFGQGWIMLYNGAKCGASAPDHFHFQAVPSGVLPIEREILGRDKLVQIARKDGVFFYLAKDAGRAVIVLEGDAPVALEAALRTLIDSLKKVLGTNDEPMLNLVGLRGEHRVQGPGSGGQLKIIVFPRRKHRPDAFFRTGDDRIAISPAVVEMGGVFVAPFARDFERLDVPAAESIYREVSLDEKNVKRAIEAMLPSKAYSTSS